MADFGAMFRADDGSLLVTSDTPCYELWGTFAPTGRSGNVNTYSVNAPEFPLIAVNCGAGNSAGVLAVEGGAGAWTVSVLSSVSCDILAFIPISGSASSGYGLAAYDSSGRLVFDSTRKILNARHVSMLSEGASFQSTSGINTVSYTSGPVRPAKSESEELVLVESWGYSEVVYQCRFETQYNCYQEQVYVCNNVYVCTPTFSCTVDPFTGGFSCGYVDSCGFQTVCGFETQTVCRTEVVQICEFVNIISFADIYGLIKTTNWTIDRGVASVGYDGLTSFSWLQHKSGYYKQVLSYQTFSYSSATVNGLPVGYTPPPVFFVGAEAFEGELNKDNTFPYTSDRANNIPLACITAVRSDYD